MRFQGLPTIAAIMLAAAILPGCATSYRFQSIPDGASVYHRGATQRELLGQTPIDYAKAGLPTDGPFLIEVEKPGFETREVAITPTDNALTTISVQLKAKDTANSDESLKRARGILTKVFLVQEKIYQKKYVDALATLKALESEESKLPEVFVLRGSIYVLLGDKDQAKKEWSRALELDPGLDELKVRLSKLQAADGGAKS